MNLETFVPVISSFIGAILGAIVGGYFTYLYSYKLFAKQKIFENQRTSFAKILSLKNPWSQSLQTHLEAKLLSEFYETRFKLFSHNIEDINEAKMQYERSLLLIKEISNYQKEIFESLAIIQISFSKDVILQKAIENVYNYKMLEIKTFPTNFAKIDELEKFKVKAAEEITLKIEQEYKVKMESLINILKSKL